MIDTFQKAWESFSGTILGMLPTSPTVDSDALAALSSFTGYINYFIPVGPFLTFAGALLSVVAGYYLTMAILRWLKLIG